mgnify:FL=1
MGERLNEAMVDAPRWRELTTEAMEAVRAVMIEGSVILAGRAAEAGGDVDAVQRHLDDAAKAVGGGEHALSAMVIAHASNETVYAAAKVQLEKVRAAYDAVDRARWACIAVQTQPPKETAPPHEVLREVAEAA